MWWHLLKHQEVLFEGAKVNYEAVTVEIKDWFCVSILFSTQVVSREQKHHGSLIQYIVVATAA